MRFGPSALVALALGVTPACTHETVAVQTRTPPLAAAMLVSRIEATESELAELYRALGDVCEAQGDHARAEEWFGKSVALKKFKMTSAPAQPLPADLAGRKLP